MASILQYNFVDFLNNSKTINGMTYDMLQGRTIQGIGCIDFLTALSHQEELQGVNFEWLKSKCSSPSIFLSSIGQMRAVTVCVFLKAMAELGFEKNCEEICKRINQEQFFKSLKFGFCIPSSLPAGNPTYSSLQTQFSDLQKSMLEIQRQMLAIQAAMEKLPKPI